MSAGIIVTIAQWVGAVLGLTTLASIFIRQGKYIQRTEDVRKDLDKRIKTLEKSNFITEKENSTSQELCRTRVYADMNKCQLTLQSDITAMDGKINAMSEDITDLKKSVKENAQETRELKELIIHLTSTVKSNQSRK